MAELGMEINNFSIIQQYKNLLTHIIIDQTDCSCASEIENLGLNVYYTKHFNEKSYRQN